MLAPTASQSGSWWAGRAGQDEEDDAAAGPTKRENCFGRPYEGSEVLRSSLLRERSASVVPTKGAKSVRRPSPGLCEVPKLRANLAISPTLESLLLSKEAPRRTPLVSDRRLPVLLALSKWPLDETRWSLIDG